MGAKKGLDPRKRMVPRNPPKVVYFSAKLKKKYIYRCVPFRAKQFTKQLTKGKGGLRRAMADGERREVFTPF